jgi:hypothetical protein
VSIAILPQLILPIEILEDRTKADTVHILEWPQYAFLAAYFIQIGVKYTYGYA